MEQGTYVAKVLSYLSEEGAKNLHQQALTEIVEVLLNFLGEYENAVSWVTNAAPGHGKTTAMRLVLQFLADQRPKRNKIPVLVALRYKGDLDELEATLNAHKPDSCIAVHSDNVADNLLDAAKYQFVLTTFLTLETRLLPHSGYQHEIDSRSRFGSYDENLRGIERKMRKTEENCTVMAIMGGFPHMKLSFYFGGSKETEVLPLNGCASCF